MAGHGLGRAAAVAVAGFLKGRLPWEEEGWYDHASTAFQIGCEALVALGQAEARDWGGALARTAPACGSAALG
jgi:pellino protein